MQQSLSNAECRRLLGLALPSRFGELRRGLLLVRDGETVVRALAAPSLTELEPSALGDDDQTTRELARRLHARWAVTFSPESAKRLSYSLPAGFESLALPGQLAELHGGLLRLAQADEVELWPWGARLTSWAPAVLSWSLEALCPDGSTCVVAAFDGSRLHAALVVRRAGTGVDFVGGARWLDALTGVRSGDWRRDQRFVTAAVERELGPVALGCFAELATFRGLRDAAAGAWTAALLSGDVVVSPMPLVSVLPFGVDLGRAVLGTLDSLFAEDGRAPDGVSALWRRVRRPVPALGPVALVAPLLALRRAVLTGRLD